MWWLVPVLVLPFLELWSLLELGSVVGVWPTLAWCVAMVVLGVGVIRLGRTRMVDGLRHLERRGPGAVLEHGLLVMAGGLLAFPGVGTDVLGLLLLLPFVRGLVMRRMRSAGASRSAAWQRRWSRAPRQPMPDEPPLAQDVEIYPPGTVRLPNRRRPVVIDVD